MNGLPAMHHDDERAFPAEKIYKELEECIDSESLGAL